MRIILFLCIFLLTNILSANTIEILQFDNQEQEKQYSQLIKELRCLKCQNSSIAGSNAGLAKDLRLKVHRQIVEQHMSDTEIKQWMTNRYGDFVLYDPPLKTSTIVLWALPILLVLLGFTILVFRLKKQPMITKKLNEYQQNKLDEILNQ